MAVLLACRRLSAGYSPGRWVVRDVALELRAAERLVITGPAGAGKTTLLYALLGLLKRAPESELWAFGVPVNTPRALTELRRRAVLLFQHVESQWLAATVGEEILFTPCAHNMPPAQAEARRDAALRAVGLEDMELARPLFSLPPLQRKLATLAALLVMEPDVLLLDDPLGGLGETEARGLVEVLKTLPQALLIACRQPGPMCSLSPVPLNITDLKAA